MHASLPDAGAIARSANSVQTELRLPLSLLRTHCVLRGDHARTAGTLLGWPVLVSGASVLLWCVRDVYVIGNGTLAPWNPPKKLVKVGLYRFVRNPIYVGVLGFVAGWSLIAGSWRMLAHAGVLAIGFHLRVILYEEPTLARLFENEWEQYRASVHRWWPKRPSR